MEPTLNNGDLVVVSRLAKVKKGDIYAYYYQNMILVKRIIGMPGDEIVIDEEGRVFVNKLEIDEPYVIEKGLGLSDLEYPYVVEEGKLFLIGDNRAGSIDSRVSLIGDIHQEDIIGKAIYRVVSIKKIVPLY